ncbi:hypothetical protein DFH29DRAFT_1084926 [Suillus ampliporus]|nr:hypothetical protein DFH29DRAFT_1084926 [Suillus ampliporus]
MIRADGAKGVMRKQLGLVFLGETRNDYRFLTGDVRLKGVGLNRVFHERAISLRPTDEIAEDGWPLFIFSDNLDLTKIAESEELLFETIVLLIPTEVTFNKLIWMSDFRCVFVFSVCIDAGPTVSSVPIFAW